MVGFLANESAWHISCDSLEYLFYVRREVCVEKGVFFIKRRGDFVRGNFHLACSSVHFTPARSWLNWERRVGREGGVCSCLPVAYMIAFRAYSFYCIPLYSFWRVGIGKGVGRGVYVVYPFC